MSAARRFIGFARPMTISISRNYFWEIFFEDEPTKRRYEPNDEFDILWQFPSQFGKGHSRIIELGVGLGLLINDCQLHDHLELKVPERGGGIGFDFYLTGGGEVWDIHTGNHRSSKAGQYLIASNGMLPAQASARKDFVKCLANLPLAIYAIADWNRHSSSCKRET